MRYTLLYLALILSTSVLAQTQEAGNVINDFGKTYIVESPDFKTNTTETLKVVFDVGRSFDNPSKPNPLIETAARFLNMHEKAGVSIENMEVALVIHGAAANDLLIAEAYKEHNKLETQDYNPNGKLITALAEKGVTIILCGQTAAHRNITKENLHPDVKLALSAMTALVQLQNDGFRLINF